MSGEVGGMVLRSSFIGPTRYVSRLDRKGAGADDKSVFLLFPLSALATADNVEGTT